MTSVWQSADPILGKYLPTGDKEGDAQLPGMGGIYNAKNLALYNYVSANPILYLDPNGKEVTATLNMKTKTLTVIDNDTGKTVRVEAFAGGNSRSGSIVSPGPGKEAPIPTGEYFIVDNPNPTAGNEDWYGVFKIDGRIDDYFDDAGKERSGVRLHKGQTSWGCVTVNKWQPNADIRWEKVIQLLDSTKTGDIEFKKGPHWWNSTGETTKYGILKVINE